MGRTTGLAQRMRRPARRWPWALAAIVAGALGGGGVAYAVRRVQGQDSPDAVEPEQRRAVVDRPDDTAAGAGPA